jgi:hypothetical protein
VHGIHAQMHVCAMQSFTPSQSGTHSFTALTPSQSSSEPKHLQRRQQWRHVL